MKVDILGIDGSNTGSKADLPKGIFGVDPNEHAIYLSVKAFLAAQRQGTHKAKERNEIKGSTRKIKKQKGTGTARAGSIKNPLFKGGGRVFGPRPRKYNLDLNKKQKQLAKISALSAKAAGKEISVVQDFDFELPKTKDFVGILNALGLSEKKTLLVTGKSNESLHLSARNLPKAKVVDASRLHVYDIMNADTVLFAEAGLASLTEQLTK